MPRMIIAATGHRPDKLGGYDEKTRRALGGLATEYLHYERPELAISGMALGWDQAFAAAAVVLGIPFIAAIPFEGQERMWPNHSQIRYCRLLEHAARVEIIVERKLPFNIAGAMQTRNEWMVDNSIKLAALWDGSSGGTCNCIRYAEKTGVPYDNLWNRWAMPEDIRELLGDWV